jgi:hypothetical protein
MRGWLPVPGRHPKRSSPKMGRLRAFLYPSFDQFLVDLTQKTLRHGVAPFSNFLVF